MRNVLKTVKGRVRKRLRARRERASGLLQAIRIADEARDRREWMVAARLYRTALEIAPERAALRVQLGHMLKESGDLEAASDEYQLVLDITPHDADLRLQIGHLEKLKGDLDAAIRYYQQALFLDKDNFHARRELIALTGSDFVDAVKIAASIPAPARQSESRASPIVHARPGKPLDLKNLADVQREAQDWLAGIDSYRAYLAERPHDSDAWQGLGDCFRGAGNFPAAASAYGSALDLQPDDPGLLTRAGALARQRGRISEAVTLLGRAAQRSPTREIIGQLEEADPHLDLTALAPSMTKLGPLLFLEISDLIEVMKSQSSLSGIQRVQFGLLSYVLDLDARRQEHILLVSWWRKRLWLLDKAKLRKIIDNYSEGWGLRFGGQKTLIASLESFSSYVLPSDGDTFLSTGVIYFHPDLVTPRESMRRRGVVLGAAIYDFIPLTHPEFCSPVLTREFSPTIAETLVHTDFAITISEFVAREAVRLISQAGFPPIPIRAVLLANSFEARSMESAADSWDPDIAALRDSEFVLNVSTLNAHKNQIFLLHIWRLLIERGIDVPKLILIGRRSYGVDDLYTQLEATNYLDHRVLILDGPTDEALTTLYRNCLFTMFPSFVEGWGLPVGESLSYGKVCICSDTSSIPEVGRDLALYIDPYNVRAAADLVAGLLADRVRLEQMEERIGREFRPRTWSEYSQDFLSVAADLARQSRGSRADHPAPRAVLEPSQMLRPSTPSAGWPHGAKLPAWAQMAEVVMPRIVFRRGWAFEDHEAWMEAGVALLSIPVGAEAKGGARIALSLRSRDLGRYGPPLTISSSCGAKRTARVQGAALAWLDCEPDAEGYIDLTISCERATVGRLPAISSVVWFPAEEFHGALAPGEFASAAGAVAQNGSLATPTTPDGIREVLDRRSMLAEGWDEPNRQGAPLNRARAKILFYSALPPGANVRTALKFRAEASRRQRRLRIRQSSHTESQVPIPREGGDVIVWQDFTVSELGTVEFDLRLETDRGDAGARLARGIEFVGLAYARSGSDADRLALFEALFSTKFEKHAQPRNGEGMGAAPTFVITGHLKGSYSLAAVNRRLALALDGAFPGRVRTEQVEGSPLRDLSDIPTGQRDRLAQLATRTLPDGPEVVISQHWPLWAPPERGRLALAYVFWEESMVPLEMVRRLNEFDGVLAPSTIVARSLVNSGVAVPVRSIGYAPKLDEFIRLGERRLTRHLLPRGPGGPFTFLHVSSAFPRKGVDVLLAAYASAFSQADPVRLVIKAFPNPHNDTPAQLARMREKNPRMAPVELINQDLSENALAELYGRSDVMVLPTRGEGFNIPAAEAMASGLGLIVTGFGAQTDFLPDDARRLDFEFANSKSHVRSSGSVWADPSVDDLIDAMRSAVKAARTPAERNRRARALDRARNIGDPERWARRVSATCADMLRQPYADYPHVAWISTWNVRCGIAEYSRLLLEELPEAAANITVFCDDRTTGASLAGAALPAEISWRAFDDDGADQLARAIAEADADFVLIQHHKAPLTWVGLVKLLNSKELRDRPVILMLHNVVEFPRPDSQTYEDLVLALRGVRRVLVHSLRDMNLLKERGLLDNVAMIRHGASLPTGAPRPVLDLPRAAAPLIGSHGFFVPHKGFSDLIGALARLRQAWPNARLRLVAAEHPDPVSLEEIRRCRALSETLGVSDAIEWHTSFLPREEALRLMSECDLLVLPYQETPESASGAVRTALASLSPILVTPLPIFDDVEDAVLRLQGFDEQKIYEGVAWLLENAPARRDLQDRARNWLNANSWSVIAERLSGTIQGLYLEWCAEEYGRARPAVAEIGPDAPSPTAPSAAGTL